MIAPMSFHTVWDLTRSMEAAILSSAYILFDNSMITLNQYILLDPIMLFFMTAATMGMVRVSKLTEAGVSFTRIWWSWLFFTGAMLASTIGVKFVGLFVVLLVGFHTINDLWRELGDISKPIMVVVKQLIARGITLILFPALLYTFYFFIHLSVLNRSGTGDGFYSSGFQAHLIGNTLHNAYMPRHVAYGALVTIKNHKTGGGYLHSHAHLYAAGYGAPQQQITTYSHKDSNNEWKIKPYKAETPDETVQIIKHGDLVRLEHIQTRRNLHSHREMAPITKKHYQVHSHPYCQISPKFHLFSFFSSGHRIWRGKRKFNWFCLLPIKCANSAICILAYVAVTIICVVPNI